MICEACQGARYIPITKLAELVGPTGVKDTIPYQTFEPCRECNAQAVTHCCEGERPGNLGVA